MRFVPWLARGLVAIADSVQRFAPADVEKQPTQVGDFQYAGVDDHYFMTAVLNPGPSTTVTFQHTSIPPPAGAKEPARDLISVVSRSSWSPCYAR